MATTSDNVDYSFSNDEKLIIHNQNSENNLTEENAAGPSSETNIRIDSVESVPGNCGDMGTSQEKNPINVNEAITKLETMLKDLKKQRDVSPEDKRIIRDVSKKRSRKKKFTSSPRKCDSSSDSSKSYPDRSPSPKRTKKDSPRKKYDSDSSSSQEGRYKQERYKFREGSLSSLSSDRSYSCVSNKLKKELSNFLGNSFVSINSKKNTHPRKSRRDRSRSLRRKEGRDSYGRSRYSKREYSRNRSRSKSGRDDSYDRYSKRKSSRRHSERYNNYNRNYQQVNANDIEERYSRYYAVMYAFSIIMDILRQDDIYSTF